MAQLSIPYSSSALESCKPDLMPFHIAYNGPAPVSQFMRVEKLRRDDSASSPVDPTKPLENMASGGQDDADVLMAEIELPANNGAAERLPLTATSSIATVCDTPAVATPSSEMSEATLVPTTSVDSDMSESIRLGNTESQNLLDIIPSLDEMDKRVVAAFRGRAIHGLEIDLPSGYSGLVLLSDSEPKTASSSSKKSKEPSKVVAKARETTPEEPTSSRRRGRLTRSAALPKHIVTVDDTEEVVDLSNDVEEEESPETTQWQDDQTQRNLTPISTFNSFTLWQTDRPVDKNRDEYYRTLNEWIGLAHVVHGCE